MIKFILKLVAVLTVVGAAVIGLSYWNKTKEPDYIEIYSDDDEDFTF